MMLWPVFSTWVAARCSHAKVDIEAAYRIVGPVHHEDRWLLGMWWQGSLFVDTVFPFGLRSSTKEFTAGADAQA